MEMLFASIATAVLVLGSSAASAAAILESGNEMDANTVSSLTIRGFAVTNVSASALASTSLTDYAGVWLSWGDYLSND